MYCGTSNIVLPVANKSQFPETFRLGTRLSYYASIFNTVELNSTFYKLPMAATVKKWAEQVPDDFLFTVKLWKTITHQRELAFSTADMQKFFEVTNGFGEKKGCLLVQFPASVKYDWSDRFEALLDEVCALNNGWQLAIEFRDKGWYTDRIYALLETNNCCLVEHDMPKSATPAELPASATRYVRFHGTAGDYRGSYEETFLEHKAADIAASEKRGQRAFVYFNNTIGAAVYNAILLQTYSKSL